MENSSKPTPHVHVDFYGRSQKQKSPRIMKWKILCFSNLWSIYCIKSVHYNNTSYFSTISMKISIPKHNVSWSLIGSKCNNPSDISIATTGMIGCAPNCILIMPPLCILATDGQEFSKTWQPTEWFLEGFGWDHGIDSVFVVYQWRVCLVLDLECRILCLGILLEYMWEFWMCGVLLLSKEIFILTNVRCHRLLWKLHHQSSHYLRLFEISTAFWTICFALGSSHLPNPLFVTCVLQWQRVAKSMGCWWK